MSQRSLDELRDLAPGYVMQSLTLEEHAAFEQALRDPALAEALAPELAAYREVVEGLAASQAVAPPAALRGRVQARIRSEAASAAPAVAPPAPTLVTSTPRPSRALVTVLALACAASLLFVVSLQRQLSALRDRVATQDAATAQLRTQLAQREATLRTLTDAGSQLLLVRLSPNTNAGPSLQLFWNVKRGRAVVFASGLRNLDSARTYQLWMIRDGKPVSVTLFRPDVGGSKLLDDIAVPTASAGVAAFAVTEEPAGGSPQPTMTPFLVGTVQAGQ